MRLLKHLIGGTGANILKSIKKNDSSFAVQCCAAWCISMVQRVELALPC